MTEANKRLRIVNLSGPINAVEVYERWSRKEKTADYFGTVYLEQLLIACEAIGCQLYTITTLQGGEDRVERGNYTFHNYPTPENCSGLEYHMRCIAWYAKLIPHILRFKPQLIVVTALQNYWFMLIFLKLFRIKILPDLHCVIWPQFSNVRFSQKLLNILNYPFYAYCASEFLVVSADITRQLHDRFGVSKQHIHEFIPTYQREAFQGFEGKCFSDRPFVIFFAGRIEVNKGIFDLVEIGRRLEKQNPGSFIIHLCGEGRESNLVQKAIREMKLEHVIRFHGYCNIDQQKRLIMQSHVFIVPTTTAFEEGFNKVCAEGALSLRPVITSVVCPALNYIRKAALEVPPDDVDRYFDAIQDLSSNRSLYESKVAACRDEREKFLVPDRGYGPCLMAALKRQIGPG